MVVMHCEILTNNFQRIKRLIQSRKIFLPGLLVYLVYFHMKCLFFFFFCNIYWKLLNCLYSDEVKRAYGGVRLLSRDVVFQASVFTPIRKETMALFLFFWNVNNVP